MINSIAALLSLAAYIALLTLPPFPIVVISHLAVIMLVLFNIDAKLRRK